ncbi:MAG TPA: CPBP family glutamic-type intramembrane protease [Planctomycetota bacterium]|nr:CPBP family glutamic-type intramembrane protease [Planctomycetota bacterium]
MKRGLYSQADADAAPGDEPLTGVAAGFLAMLPLLAAYEWGQDATGGARRNVGERLLTLAFEPFGDADVWIRRAACCAAALAAWLALRGAGVRARAAVSRVVLEGVVGAIVLGPLLVVGMALLGAHAPAGLAPAGTGEPPPLGEGALLVGGSAWEELCFRLGGYGLCFVLAAAPLRALGLGETWTRRLAEASGLVGSSALFAVAHLARFNARLGPGGARFEPGHFTWLCLAGLLLGLLFRLRGPGVAAWSHALFNLGLYLGVDPDVLA